MDILKKSIAPITDDAWKEIKEAADDIFNNYLTAREFVDIDGPNGMGYGAVTTGKLIIPKKQSRAGINYGIREVIPVLEIRKPFELDIWELDNIERGSKDVDLGPLEEAAKEVALFEENAIYNGFPEAQIKGLTKSSEIPVVIKKKDTVNFLKVVGEQIISLKKQGVGGPYTLIVDDENYQRLITENKGFPVIRQLKEIIDGKIILNHNNKNSFIVTERGGDYELYLGQDISIGYDGHNTEKVKLYFTESFTFRVHSPEAIRVINNAE